MEFTFPYSNNDLKALTVGMQITIPIDRVNQVFDIAEEKSVTGDKWFVLRQNGIYAGLVLVK